MLSKPATDWLIAVCVLYPLSTAAIVLRLLAVRVRGARLKLPDYLILLSWVCQTGYGINIAVLGLGFGGYGEHITQLSLDRIISSLKALWISQWFWAFGVNSFRLAILLLYVDVFCTRVFRWQAIGTAAVVIGYFIACILTICLLCRPLRSSWDLTVKGTCGNQVAIEYFSAAFNMAIDLWVVYLPLPTIWKLQLSPAKKWMLTASFSLGLGTAAASLGRLIQTMRCQTATDATFCFLNSSILVFAEFSSGVLVACVPTLGPLFVRRSQSKPAPKANSGSTGGPVCTIGSVPMRRYKRSKGTTFGSASLFSQTETCTGSPDEVDDTAALAMRGTQMGHQAEVRGSEGYPSFEHEFVELSKSNGIVRTLGYNVK